MILLLISSTLPADCPMFWGITVRFPTALQTSIAAECPSSMAFDKWSLDTNIGLSAASFPQPVNRQNSAIFAIIATSTTEKPTSIISRADITTPRWAGSSMQTILRISEQTVP